MNDIEFLKEEKKKIDELKKDTLIREIFINLVTTINEPQVNRLWIHSTNMFETVVVKDVDHLALFGKIFLNKYRQKYAPDSINKKLGVTNIMQQEKERIKKERIKVQTKETILRLIEALKSPEFGSLHVSWRNGFIGFYSKDIDSDFTLLVIKILETYYQRTYCSAVAI